MTQLLHRREQENILILTLNAPEQRNALSAAMREELREALQEAAASRDCRAIVLTGAGGHFCSGGQVKSANGNAGAPNAERTLAGVRVLHDVVRILAAGPKPSVAAVEGSAYGAGLSLAAACDYLVAGEGAKFCASFARIGLMADAGLMWSLPQRIGFARSRELMLTGRVVAADEAEAIGLANRGVPAGAALEAAVETARGMAKLAPLALSSIKRTLGQGPSSLEEVLAHELEEQPRLASSQDYAEGRAAFHERREPVFRSE